MRTTLTTDFAKKGTLLPCSVRHSWEKLPTRGNRRFRKLITSVLQTAHARFPPLLQITGGGTIFGHETISQCQIPLIRSGLRYQ